MYRWICGLSLLFSILCAEPALGAQTAISLVDLKEWTLIVSPDALPSERYAAEEFQSLFEQATGVHLPIANTPPRTTHNVFIGLSSAMQSSPAGFSVDDLGEEGLRIRIQPDTIAIAGGRPRGTLYGVYEFMERYLGIRFLTHDHTYIPPRSPGKIPCEDWSYTPPFTFRWSYYKENADNPAFAARLRVNTTTHDEKLGGVTRQSLISHSLNYLLPVETYGKEHPEYFALVDGERKLEMWGGGPEPCVTNPDVIEIVAQNVIKELDKNPNQQNYSVSQNDNNVYCHCERCEAINQREGTPMGSHLEFVNAVAERVEKKYPNVKIGTLAYWYTRKPPKTIQPRHNVQIQLCSIECSTLYPLDDPTCKKNLEFCKEMDIWGKICDDIWIWNYNTNFRFYDLPFPNLRVISPNIQYFLKNHVKGVFMQANGNGGSGELCDLRNYVMARCLWDPQLDSWKLAKEFCDLHYGKAGKTLFAYLEFLHDNAEKTALEPTCFPMPFELGLHAKSSDRIYEYFQKALSQAENETVRDRVEKASICADRALLETAGQLETQNGVLRITYPEKYGDLVDRYTKLTQKHAQTRAEEWEPIDHYYQILKKATQDGYAAEILENKTWCLILLPEQNGKIVELYHKPSKNHILMPPEYRNTRNLFEYLTLEEQGEKGYNHNEPATFSPQKQGESITLTKTLKDGSTIQRIICLREKTVDFDTQITHRGEKEQDYQIRIHPEIYTGAITNDSQQIGAYIRDDQWIKFNDGWSTDNEPGNEIIQNAKGGGFALYNHPNHYGIVETYDPAQFDAPSFWWSDQYPMAHLDLHSKTVTLKPGESTSFQYSLELVRQWPK